MRLMKRRLSTLVSLVCVACAMVVSGVAAVAVVPYPIEASWFQNRWTVDDWITALTPFKAQGGTTVWQRGVPLVLRDEAFFMTDPDWAWCVYDEFCIDRAKDALSSRGLILGDFYTYSNDEEYLPEAIMKCPGLDIKIVTSRYHYRLVVPHGAFNPLWNCSQLKSGDTVDVIFTIWNGLDPHHMLLEAADRLGMQVFLPQPSVPGNPNPNVEGGSAFYEFLSRVMHNYELLYGDHPSYVGVYQNNEAGLCLEGMVDFAAGYQVCADLTHAQGKLFATSPYSLMPRHMFDTSVKQHKEGFKMVARAGSDIIAVQDGRGSGFCSFWWQFQANMTLAEVDPMLDKVAQYHLPAPVTTFAETYWASNQLLWRAFEEAVDELEHEEHIHTELWLNVEAFEYLRDAPCLPIDEGGNGMAELLDRTSKSRVDWALTVDGARGSHIISFAWDADFLCTNGGYPKSLAQEILDDWDRPIVSYLDPVNGLVRGFNLAPAKQIKFSVSCSSGKKGVDVPVSVDAAWGKTHNRSPLLQQAVLPSAVVTGCAKEKWVCIHATNTVTGKTSFHEYCSELGIHP